MTLPRVPTENQLLLQVWNGELSVVWPLDAAAREFSLVGAGAGLFGIFTDPPAITIGTGKAALFLLSERFTFSRLAPLENVEGRQRVVASPRKRFDRRFVRNPLYRLFADEVGPAPVEARIRPAEQIGADWKSSALSRFRFGNPVDSYLLVQTDSPGDGNEFQRLSAYAESRLGLLPSVTAESVDGKALTGKTPLLEIRSSRMRLVVPPAFVAGIFGGDPPESDAKQYDADWWGRVLTILAFDTQRFIAARGGLSHLVLSSPFTARQQSAGRALRLVTALLRLDSAGLGVFIDHCYRRQSSVNALRTLYTYGGSSSRRAIRSALGERRIDGFLVPFHPATIRSSVSLGDTIADAAGEIAGSLAERIRRRGDALPAELDALVRSVFVEPRSRASFVSFRKDVDEGSLAAALEAARLSRLRRQLRALPRQVLVDAAVGDTGAVRKRISAIYSRRGRRLFYEDLEAREGAVRRDSVFDYAAVLAARNRVRAIARRLAL